MSGVARAQAVALGAALCRAYPQAFPLNGRQPLAVGIRAQIIDAFPTVPVGALQTFLKYWVSRYGYRKSLTVPGAARVNLDGSVQGLVSDYDREHAIEKLKQFKTAKATA